MTSKLSGCQTIPLLGYPDDASVYHGATSKDACMSEHDILLHKGWRVVI